MSNAKNMGGAASGDIRDHFVFRLALYTTIADRNGKVLFPGRFGLTLREYRILGVIGYAEPISLMDLADECYLDKGQVSRVVAKLSDEGNIGRIHDEDVSARGGKLKLTDKGRVLLGTALAYGQELNEKALSVLTDSERRLFSDWLDRILAHARNMYDETHG
ncbi:hypothetical protein AS156_18495 [Bradyrhizobium macuxiense]|uniref:HTH marR-type domain-containing protein n=1 Tax=Bradyrhizobium macuxiense TaxID=1755647 RepID=A0A109JGJ0_9BRAD|nr:MarR family winged helix-turn-helix transcriptional regulator [Bradyrhizobium macuxiense]KWV48466.1 hypothetical protein AS156_18495 [Bradyrhizobium macuxiense]